MLKHILLSTSPPHGPEMGVAGKVMPRSCLLTARRWGQARPFHGSRLVFPPRLEWAFKHEAVEESLCPGWFQGSAGIRQLLCRIKCHSVAAHFSHEKAGVCRTGRVCPSCTLAVLVPLMLQSLTISGKSLFKVIYWAFNSVTPLQVTGDAPLRPRSIISRAAASGLCSKACNKTETEETFPLPDLLVRDCSTSFMEELILGQLLTGINQQGSSEVNGVPPIDISSASGPWSGPQNPVWPSFFLGWILVARWSLVFQKE